MSIYSELADRIDGYHAYDSGATDSGIHNPEQRAEDVRELLSMDSIDREAILDMVAAKYMVPPYVPEDVEEFRDWVERDFI